MRFSNDGLALCHGIESGCELALHLHGDAPGLIGGQTLAIGPDGVAADAPGSPRREAVLDQEHLTSRGRDLHPEPRQVGIEHDPVPSGRCERIDRALGQLEAGLRGGGPFMLR